MTCGQGKQKTKRGNAEIQTFLWLEKLTASRQWEMDFLKEFKQQRPRKSSPVNKVTVIQVKYQTKNVGFRPDLSQLGLVTEFWVTEYEKW